MKQFLFVIVATYCLFTFNKGCDEIKKDADKRSKKTDRIEQVLKNLRG